MIDREENGIEIRAADGDPVLERFDANTETHAQTEQIARLIAAAPSLLEACKEALRLAQNRLRVGGVAGPGRDTAKTLAVQLIAAIAAAEGREP